MELPACTEYPTRACTHLLMPILCYLICLPSSSGSQGSEMSQPTTLCLLLTTPPLA